MDHEHYMRCALELGEEAFRAGEIPIGAVVVQSETVIGKGFNRTVATHDPTAHAEILAVREACAQLGNYRLPGSTLYVTLEPCLMCVGMLVHTRISTLVFGALEPKWGAVSSQVTGLDFNFHNHHIEVVPRILEDQCRELIQSFFRRRRARSK